MWKKQLTNGLVQLAILLTVLKLRNVNDLNDLLNISNNYPEIREFIEGPTSAFTQTFSYPLSESYPHPKIFRNDYENILNEIYDLTNYDEHVISRGHRDMTTLLMVEAQNGATGGEVEVAGSSTASSNAQNLSNFTDGLDIFPGTSLTKDDINLIDDLWQQEEIDSETNSENAVASLHQKGAYSFLDTFTPVLDKFETKEPFLGKPDALFQSTSESSRYLSAKTNDSFDELGIQPTNENKGNELQDFLNANFTTNTDAFGSSIPEDVLMSDAFISDDQETPLDNLLRDLDAAELEVTTPEIENIASNWGLDMIPNSPEANQDESNIKDDSSDSGVSSRGSTTRFSPTEEHLEDSRLPLYSISNPPSDILSLASDYTDTEPLEAKVSHYQYENSTKSDDESELEEMGAYGGVDPSWIQHDHPYSTTESQHVHRQMTAQRHHSIVNTRRPRQRSMSAAPRRALPEPVNVQKHTRSRDEKKAKAMKIPLTISQIVNSAVEDFNDLIADHHLTEPQLQLIRDIRRRGKNKVAAQNCRKRKIEVIDHLEKEVNTLRQEKTSLEKEEDMLKRQVEESRRRIEELSASLFNEIPKPYEGTDRPGDYTLEQTEDGRLFMMPKESTEKTRQSKSSRKRKGKK
ncbi:DgyrCDS4707 [Dimorphilus gyrociliatus]|uniref:DgyrCDS4707 n=1 Tax=Dimorphilus gyrociliatus TaxID=2664684 RepID=A0A7I8VHU0_9ANNE|nr:DgyrCDS4707 [Dimorphilus gyrociliatus]